MTVQRPTFVNEIFQSARRGADGGQQTGWDCDAWLQRVMMGNDQLRTIGFECELQSKEFLVFCSTRQRKLKLKSL